MRICAYSSLIFACNTTVLLIVSLTTDYWEYRTFDRDKLISSLRLNNVTRLVMPHDTTSYFQIVHVPVNYRRATRGHQLIGDAVEEEEEEAFYHAPLFVRQKMSGRPLTNSSITKRSDQMDGVPIRHSEISLFEQYGNLFRDCDDLEDIESWAAGTALLCMITICVASLCGARALFSRDQCQRSYNIASTLSLVAGFFLTLGIALFHGKCQLLRKMELLPGRDLPFRDILNSSRVYSYGWSFILAWICVLFCYTASYVWLTKAQGSRSFVMRWHSEDPPSQNIRRGSSHCLHIATV